MDGSPYILQWNAIPPKLPFLMGYLDPSNIRNWATRVHIPNGISIGSAVFCRAPRLRQTDRPTDRQTTLLRLQQYIPHVTYTLQCVRP